NGCIHRKFERDRRLRGGEGVQPARHPVPGGRSIRRRAGRAAAMKPVRARGRRAARRRAAALALAWGGTSAGCAGVQSALGPAGPNAREISVLWWSMAAAAAVILTLVVGLLLYAVFGHPERRGWLTPHRLIVFGGMVL